MKIINALLIILCLITLGFSEKSAFDSSKLKNKRISIECEGGMNLKTESRQASFYDDVVVSMGNLHMQCQRLDIEYVETEGKLQPKILRGTGKVFCEEKEQNIQAWCDNLVYDHSTEILTVTSKTKCKVIKDGHIFEGPGYNIFLKTGEVKTQNRIKLEINLE